MIIDFESLLMTWETFLFQKTNGEREGDKIQSYVKWNQIISLETMKAEPVLNSIPPFLSGSCKH